MKLIVFNRVAGDPVEAVPAIDLIPDSAIILPGRPIFLPVFSSNWKAELLPAVRISRLGKAIKSRFAPRYYDAMTLLLRLRPIDLEEELHAKELSTAIASSFDNCIQLGEWLELPPEGIDRDIEISFSGQSVNLTPSQIKINEAIESVSRFLTIKNGDIIAPLAIDPATDVAVGLDFRASINSRPTLTARLK